MVERSHPALGQPLSDADALLRNERTSLPSPVMAILFAVSSLSSSFHLMPFYPRLVPLHCLCPFSGQLASARPLGADCVAGARHIPPPSHAKRLARVAVAHDIDTKNKNRIPHEREMCIVVRAINLKRTTEPRSRRNWFACVRPQGELNRPAAGIKDIPITCVKKPEPSTACTEWSRQATGLEAQLAQACTVSICPAILSHKV